MLSSLFELAIPNRRDDLEIMDGADFSPYEYERTLEELELINRLTNGYQPTLQALEELLDKHKPGTPERNIRILDVGFGFGDTLRAIHRWAEKKKIGVDLVGVDLNPQARVHAEQATPKEMSIHYLTADVFKMPSVEPVDSGADGSFDIVVNSLFMHHLRDNEITRVLRWMTENARLGWVINDLHRHPIAYHFIKHATKLTGFNRLICNDAPLSVARSFRRSDWLRYLTEAGIPNSAVSIRWHFPFRYGLVCNTSMARKTK